MYALLYPNKLEAVNPRKDPDYSDIHKELGCLHSKEFMIKVSTTGMVVSLKTDLRFPIPGQRGHGGRIIQLILLAIVIGLPSVKFEVILGHNFTKGFIKSEAMM